MAMFHENSIWTLAIAAAFIASPVQAQVTPATDAEATLEALPSAEADVLSNDDLAELRGGEAIIVSNQTLVAITSGNVINGDYVAGNISLSDFALSNFNGLGNVLINTGGQVSLQSGMNVTINVGN
jgi:hypothetical protein